MNFADWANRNRWIWSLLGVLILWAILSAVTSDPGTLGLRGADEIPEPHLQELFPRVAK